MIINFINIAIKKGNLNFLTNNIIRDEIKSMKEDIRLLKSQFSKIKEIGWLELDRTNYGNIGITFEKLVGLTRNELEIPDFGSIEIKTKSTSKYDYITLFSCVPTGPHYHEVERIKDLFGYPDSKLKNSKVLNGEIFCNKLSKIGKDFYFKLNVYKEEQKITLSVYDKMKNKIEEKVYWDFDILEEKLNRKLTYLALVNVDKKVINKKTFFRYNMLNLYKIKGFNVFIYLIESGFIKVNFKLGVFRDKKRLGKIHDRGTAFLIEKKYITKLFDFME